MVRMNRIPAKPCRNLAWEELGRYFLVDNRNAGVCAYVGSVAEDASPGSPAETLECGWTLSLRLPIFSGSSPLQQAIHPDGFYVPVGI